MPYEPNRLYLRARPVRPWTLLLALLLLLAPALTVPAGVQDAPAGGDDAPGMSLGAKLVLAFHVFALLCVVALVLLAGTVAFVLWRAKKLVEGAVKPNVPKLERTIEKLRRKHPDKSDEALARKVIHRQANRAGLVGFFTGFGGLPTLPVTIPIDVALTIKIQSNLVHMLRILRVGHLEAEVLSESSLWLITTGGQELASASGVLIRDLVVKFLSKSLLKFLPVLGGVIGYGLNWVSTQALGRLTLKWLERQGAET